MTQDGPLTEEHLGLLRQAARELAGPYAVARAMQGMQMTPKDREDLMRLLTETQEIRKMVLARLREIEAVIEGILNRSPPEQNG